MSELIQCNCGGWMSPNAVACPTCGIAVPKGGRRIGLGEVLIPTDKLTSSGWSIVGWFWAVVLWALILLAIFG